MDVLMNSETGDQEFLNDSSSVTTDITLDLAQRLKIRLQSFTNEWILDTTFGVPWFQSVLGRGRSKAAVDGIIQQQIRLEPDVEQILNYQSEYTSSSRSFRISCSIRQRAGGVLNLQTTISNTGSINFNFSI